MIQKPQRFIVYICRLIRFRIHQCKTGMFCTSDQQFRLKLFCHFLLKVGKKQFVLFALYFSAVALHRSRTFSLFLYRQYSDIRFGHSLIQLCEKFITSFFRCFFLRFQCPMVYIYRIAIFRQYFILNSRKVFSKFIQIVSVMPFWVFRSSMLTASLKTGDLLAF